MEQNEKHYLDRIAKEISEITGVQLGEKQSSLVASRVRKYMRELKLSTIEEYYRHFETNKQEELENLISILTTHHTFFFREFAHFEYLLNNFQSLVDSVRKEGRSTIRIWCAACSKGQEPYSLAMFFSLHLKQFAPDMSVEILASDVDGKSVAYGENGVYPWEELKKSPANYLADHWQRGTGEIAHFVKAKYSLKKAITWKTINLLDFGSDIAGKKV